MSKYEIGIRKYSDGLKVQYWLIINGKTNTSEENSKDNLMTITSKSSPMYILNFIEESTWKIFILLTIILNWFITVNSFPFSENCYFIPTLVIVHLTCFFYWIDFLVALIAGLSLKLSTIKKRKTIFLYIDAISLIPLSIFYLLIARNINMKIFWKLRFITLLRFYRIPLHISNLATAERNHWKILVLAYAFYFFILTNLFTTYWITESYTSYDIKDWNASKTNIFMVASYFSLVTTVNVGFGDISPEKFFEMVMCSFAMLMGFIISSGVITGSLATHFANREKTREICRSEYESTMDNLRKSKFEKKIIDKISDNLLTFWRYKKNLMSSATLSEMKILPLSLLKEIYFDINFGFLSRSIVFSAQPRSFLRSVSLMMRNRSYLPGDTIMEPFGICDAMICIASGVVEILSEENDETPLASFTTGTILGEASLFVSVPIPCIIRASTQVELQVLKKTYFSRLALKYPDIYRVMRLEIIGRIKIVDTAVKNEILKKMDTDVYVMTRKKAMKYLLHELRRYNRSDSENSYIKAYKTNMLDLYVTTENLPRVKTLPINLIRAKPWILRPNTSLMNLWEAFVFLVVIIVSFTYPSLAAFTRNMSSSTYVLFFLVLIVYIIDLYIQCTTAIERKDHFTYITSVREILGHKLKTVTFYLDIIATYNLTIYADFIMPHSTEYAYILLSLNRILKFYYVPRYFIKLENNLRWNLLCLRTIKYMIYYTLIVIWSGAILYLEACPEEICIEERWYAKLEAKEVEEESSTPCTMWPPVVSLYFGSIIIATVGYGDIVAKSVLDCVTIMICIIVGAIVLTICTAQASSTLKHQERSRMDYQEEVFAVDRFMIDHDIPKDIQIKVRNYFRMQWEFDKGYTLKHHLVLEGMPVQQKDVILTDLIKKFLCVPVFINTNSNFLKVLAKSCKLTVLPPNELITYENSFLREMYIIENGYCEVSMQGNVRSLIGPLTAFGYIEMILGTPLQINVLTLTHARIISLDYSSYLRAVTKHPTVKAEIELEIEKIQMHGHHEDSFPNLGFIPMTSDAIISDESVNLILSKEFVNVYSYCKKRSSNYWEPFKSWGKLRFFQFFLIPIVIIPQSLFLKIWVSFRLATVFILCLLVPVHFSLVKHMKPLAIIIYVFQGYCWLDMFLMFHVAYYDNRGLLMFHPAKTATRYLKHNFALDIITTFPFYLVIEALYPRINENASFFHDAPGFLIVLQFYKIAQFFHQMENDILRPLPYLKTLKFVPLSIVITNIITGFIVLLECHQPDIYFNPGKNYEQSDLKSEFQESIHVFCTINYTSTYKKRHLTPLRLYLLAYYWVSATMTTCGFGDLSPYNRKTMIAVMIIIVIGLFLYGYMFANLTSSMISVYVSVTKYRRRIREMSRFMKKQRVTAEIHQRLTLHYEYNWQRTLGSSPQKMFAYVHATLKENIMASMYEATIRQVPAFIDVEKSVIKVIGKYLDEIYFLRGETIVKFNDIQEYIYLIYRGKVNVVSNNGEFITTMGSGGLFGNISQKPFSLSSVVVMATKNVDLLRLNSRMFFKTLQTFPNTKSLVAFLMSTTTDYIEPIRKQNLSEQNEVEADTIPLEIASVRMYKVSIPQEETDFKSHENNFLFKHAIYKPKTKNFYDFFILCDTWLYQTIEIINYILSISSSALTIYMFTFQEISLPFLLLSYFFDVMFIFKIIIIFNYISYFDKYGNYVISRAKIRRRYLKDKKTLGFDIAANFPLDLLVPAFRKKLMIPALLTLRLNRILRLYYIYDYYAMKFKVLMVNKIYLKLSWILCISGLAIHFMACFWYFITSPLGFESRDSWVDAMNLRNETHLNIYIVSAYYITTIVTTTGYGDIPLRSSLELITSTIYMIIGRFGVALLAGSMAAVINVQSVHLFQYQEIISNLKLNLYRQNISGYIIIKTWHYLTSLWLRETGHQIPKFIATAPHVLKCDVMNSMFGRHLQQSLIFSEVDSAFLRQLAIYLKRFIYFPGNYIVQQGDIDHTMYFIHKGQVSVLTIHTDLVETVHFELEEGDHFGMTQGLIIGKPHYFSYRAETEAEILSLTLSEWQHLLKYFPEISQKIYKRMESLPTLSQAGPKNLTSILL